MHININTPVDIVTLSYRQDDTLKQMKEADFQTAFNKWLKYHPEYHGAFELKLTHDPSLPFSAVSAHQINALKNVKDHHLIFKIPDEGYAQKPFDCFKMQGYPAHIAIMFYRRGQKTFYLIDINTWVDHVLGSKRMSITEKEAVDIGYTCILA